MNLQPSFSKSLVSSPMATVRCLHSAPGAHGLMCLCNSACQTSPLWSASLALFSVLSFQAPSGHANLHGLSVSTRGIYFWEIRTQWLASERLCLETWHLPQCSWAWSLGHIICFCHLLDASLIVYFGSHVRILIVSWLLILAFLHWHCVGVGIKFG